MAHLIGQVQLLNCVIEVSLAGIVLLSNLFVLDSKSTMLEVKFLKVYFEFSELELKFFDSLLSLLLYLAESDDLTLALLELDVQLIDLCDKSTAFLFINFL